MDEKKQEIEVVTGDGTDLNISTVYDHINQDDVPPEPNTKKDIIIPKSSS